MLREQMMELRYMMREVVERVGEALINAPEPVRVAAARQVVARRGDLFNCAADLRVFSLWILQLRAATLLAELEKAVVELRNGGLGEQPIGVLYRSEGSNSRRSSSLSRSLQLLRAGAGLARISAAWGMSSLAGTSFIG